MLRRIGTILAIAVGTLSAASCLSSVQTDGSKAVEFVPMLASEVRSTAVSSKATEVFEEFGVYAFSEDGSIFMDRERVRFDGTVWKSDEKYSWENDHSLRFLAYSPYIEKSQDLIEGSSLKIDNYNIGSAKAPVCFSELTSPLDNNSGPVVVLFNPATARLDFRLINGLVQGTRIKVEKIILQNVCVSGSFDSAKDPQWTLSDEYVDLTVYEAEDGTEIEAQEYMVVEDVLNMIPQSPEASIKVVFSLRSSESSWLKGQEAVTKIIDTEWVAGRRYTYTLTMTGGYSLNYTTGIGNWEGRQ